MGFEYLQNGRSYYQPRAFYINFRDGILDNNGLLIISGIPIFMHEYAHLIQDQNSLYGAIDFIYFLETIQEILRIRDSQGTNTVIALKQLPCSSDIWLMVLEKLKLQSRSWNDWDNRYFWAFDNFNLTEIEINYKSEFIKIPNVTGSFVDNISGKTYIHSIGSVEIKEAYSMAFEQYYRRGNEYNNFSSYEYYAVERILAQLGINDIKSIITICHWALQNHFPAERLAEIYYVLAQQNRSICAHEIYDICRAHAIKNGLQEQINKIESQLTKFIQRQFEYEGSNSPLAASIQWYHDTVVRNLQKLLDPNDYSPIDILDSCTNNINSELERLIKCYPIPQAENHDNSIYSFGTSLLAERSVFLIRSLSSIILKLWNGENKFSCPLYSSCTLEIKCHGCLENIRDNSLTTLSCPYVLALAYMKLIE